MTVGSQVATAFAVLALALGSCRGPVRAPELDLDAALCAPGAPTSTQIVRDLGQAGIDAERATARGAGTGARLAYHLARLGKNREADVVLAAEAEAFPVAVRFVSVLRDRLLGAASAQNPRP
ncbi:MAG: hypothetical protein AAF628_07485 [Planctomycetota bacterium]